MSKKKTAKDNTAAVAKTSDQPKKRLFNVEKRFGYTMHEIWTHKMSYGLVAPFFIRMKPKAESSTVNFLGSQGPQRLAEFSWSASLRKVAPTTICGS